MNDDYNAGFGFILRKSISSLKEDSEIFIASFSEEFDLLSQWRGYCPPNDGICIGFDKEIIKEFCTKNNFKFEKCIYEKKLQIEKQTQPKNKKQLNKLSSINTKKKTGIKA